MASTGAVHSSSAGAAVGMNRAVPPFASSVVSKPPTAIPKLERLSYPLTTVHSTSDSSSSSILHLVTPPPARTPSDGAAPQISHFGAARPPDQVAHAGAGRTTSITAPERSSSGANAAATAAATAAAEEEEEEELPPLIAS